jgi:hypothetical protein
VTVRTTSVTTCDGCEQAIAEGAPRVFIEDPSTGGSSKLDFHDDSSCLALYAARRDELIAAIASGKA